MTVIAVFSKYISYNAGGAEVSTKILLEKESKRGKKIILICPATKNFLGRELQSLSFNPNWTQIHLPMKYSLSRFPYIEYLLNRKYLINFFISLKVDELWTYGLFAPAAMLGFNSRIRFFIRSESDLGISKNYNYGFKFWLRIIYSLAQYPALIIYRLDLIKSVKKAEVIANSKYMSHLALDHLDIKKAKVLYPLVNFNQIAKRKLILNNKKFWIVFVGDTKMKGLNLVIDLASLMPDLSFRIFSRFVNREIKLNNVTWSPWQSDFYRIYEDARLVIVPSQCEEGYGRVAREAFLIKLPLLVSNIGGLPEAVNYKKKYLVNNYRSLSAWYEAIHARLIN
jgi:glycosyltransferase involved in cell wall biosynthesis